MIKTIIYFMSDRRIVSISPEGHVCSDIEVGLNECHRGGYMASISLDITQIEIDKYNQCPIYVNDEEDPTSIVES